ncbi:MAG: Peptide/nickel transport system substrate-binding protein, partial [Pseudonocardiales bacterium]|nr:Peptide/nickel transport system substrate-binding protein [Pseudonocardiales bacterium]
MKPSVLRSAVAAGAGLLLLSACTSPKSSGSSSSKSGGGANVVVGYGDVDNLDPVQFKANTGYTVLGNVYGTLFTENYTNKSGTLVGNNTYSLSLAKSVSYNASGTLLTIELKPGLKFEDGSPLTADDVA